MKVSVVEALEEDAFAANDEFMFDADDNAELLKDGDDNVELLNDSLMPDKLCILKSTKRNPL